MKSTVNNRAVLLGTTVLAGVGLLIASAPAVAQDATEVVTVTGYRASLTESTNAKRESVNFSDSVFSTDIGKFPDTNIAEAFNRIPGITISRENDGSGMRIAIRGLDTNFAKITLNNAVVQTMSSGPTDSGGANREVDLNIFPIELFTQLTVSKTSTADQLEGGASGVVNMRSMRPFDNPGTHLTYNVQASDYENNGNPGFRGTLIGSWTDGPFGVLLGISGQVTRPMTTGYEGAFNSMTTPNLNATQYGATCTAGSGNTNACNTLGGNTDWNMPSNTSYNTNNTNAPGLSGQGTASFGALDASSLAQMSSAAGYNITTGMPIDKAMLLAMNKGNTIDQISNALMPRTGRAMYERGTRKRYNSVLAFEYRPSEELHFYLDSILGVVENNLDREDVGYYVRNGFSIPTNLKVDANNVVLSGDFANANMNLEARPYKEKSDYFSINPGVEWQPTDLLNVKANVNYSRGHFFRDSPTFLFATPLGVVHYDNTGQYPVYTQTSLAGGLNDPANYGMYFGSDLRVQQERRYGYTQGAHLDVAYGGDAFKVTVGAAYDEQYRLIRGYDNGNWYKQVNCGANMSTYVPSPNTVVGCPPTYGYTTPFVPTFYTGWGQTGSFTAGKPYPTLGTPTITSANVPSFLRAGPAGFVSVDYDAVKAATNYNFFATHTSPSAATNLIDPGRADFSKGTNTNISSGIIDEKTQGFYGEISGTLHRGDQNIRYNIGARWIRTLQSLTGYTAVPDPRNVALSLSDGGKYPDQIQVATLHGSYSAFLPSANLVWELTDDFQLRAAVSRTMTRADPSKMLPQLSGGGSDAATWNLGNPKLKPFYSTNIDLGAELYTGGEGYIGVNLFRKMINGFQNNITTQQPFSYLAQFGVTYDTLSTTQQAAVTGGGGPGKVLVNIVQAANANGLETINGTELNWVQPLDFMLEQYGLKGFGWQANATFIKTKGSGAAPSVVLNVSPCTYNLTAYYDSDGITVRGSYAYQRGTITNSSVYGTISGLASFAEERSLDYATVDISSSIKLQKIFGELPTDPELTFDIQNLTHAKVGRSYKQYKNVLNYWYDPGSLFMIGVRGNL
jgi:TonB-dependent receptor